MNHALGFFPFCLTLKRFLENREPTSTQVYPAAEKRKEIQGHGLRDYYRDGRIDKEQEM